MRDLSTAEMSAIIALAWDDETSFDAIQAQTGLTETQVIAIMRREMKPRSFRLW
ncbi:MAG: TIGR03643 family protein, partial [Pseudomonadota bacterium]